MRFAVLAASALTATVIFADSPSVQFSRRFNELAQASVSGVRTDSAGNVYLCGRALGGTFTLLHPLESTGTMFLTKLDPGGNIVYSTMLGTGYGDTIGDCAVDADGNAYMVGSTDSASFPVTPNAVQAKLAGPRCSFLMKIDPAGQRILYSTYLGGPNDQALAIALDAQGAMYVAGVNPGTPAPSRIFITKVVPDGSFIQYSAQPDTGAVYNMKLAVTNLTEATLLITDGYFSRVLKLSAGGDRVVYRSVLPAGIQLNAIASDAVGFIWGAGASSTPDAATLDAAQSQLATHAYYRSEDGGATWSAGGLDVGTVNHMIAANGTLYAGTERGLFASTDTGRHWNRLLPDAVRLIAASADGSVYVLRTGTTPLAKTSDGGVTWQGLDPSVPAGEVLMGLAIDPQHPAALYTGARRVYRSEDGGATWTASDLLPGLGILALAVDGSDSSVLYVAVSPNYVGGGPAPSIPVSPSLMRSVDGGRSFQGGGQVNYVGSFVTDPARPGTAYAAGSILYKTIDYGAHWTPLSALLPSGSYTFTSLAIDDSGALVVTAGNGRIYRSLDGGDSFTAVSTFQISGANSVVVADGVIHLAGRRGGNAFVARLDLAGRVSYATYWGGRAYETASGIAVDGLGNVYVTGNGISQDFPERNEVRGYSGGSDAFVLKLDAAGGVVYSTSWGGSGDEYVVGIAATVDGGVYIGGISTSRDFPAALPGMVYAVGLR